MKERGGVGKGMSMTKLEEWVTESKPADESRGDEEKEEEKEEKEEKEDKEACKIAHGDQVREKHNLKAEEDFRDPNLEDEIVKDQQSLEDQIAEDQTEETSEDNITETQTNMISEDKASVSFSFSDFLSIW